MSRDEILAEVWRNRETDAALHHNSLKEMVADLRERQRRSDCRLVNRRTAVRYKPDSTESCRADQANAAP